MPHDASQTRAIRFSVLSVVSTLVVIVVYLVAVSTHLGQRIDDVAFDRRSALTAATTRRTDRLLGTVSVVSLFVVGGMIVAVALARGRLRLAIGVGIAMSGAVVTTEVLKLRLLTRPDFTNLGGVPGNSYPSGHTTIAMVLSLGIVMAAPLHLRRLALMIAAITSAVFGTAVLASGWHRPSDVIGAYFVALAWFAAVSACLALLERRAPGRRAGVDPPLSRAVLAAAALAVFALLMFVLWKSLAAVGLRTVVFAAPYIVACIGIDLAGIAVVCGYYVLQRTSATPTPGRGHAITEVGSVTV